MPFKTWEIENIAAFLKKMVVCYSGNFVELTVKNQAWTLFPAIILCDILDNVILEMTIFGVGMMYKVE